MGLPAVSFGGIASGIDTNAIVRALTDLKRRPIGLLQQRRGQINTAQSDMRTLGSHLEKLQEVTTKLKSASAFTAFTAESSDKSVLTADVDGSAQDGAFRIKVDQLARQQIDSLSGVADTDTTTFGTGTFKITVNGEENEFTLDSSNNTLTELVSEINKSDLPVTATIVNDGSDNPYNLVITADETGTDNAITYDFTGYTAGDVDLSSALTTQQNALDAELTVNGISLTRSKNLIDDAIDGVTLNLVNDQEASDNDITLTVATNVDGIVEDVQEFVDAYNTVQSFIDRQFQFDEESGAGGSLFGDFTVASVKSKLQSIITSAIDDNLFGSLGALGLASQSDGTLALNEEDLKDAIEENSAEVISLFVEGGGGLMETLDDAIEEYTKFDGILDSRSDGFDRIKKSINDQIDRAEDRLETYETNLTRRFAAFESSIGQLQSQLAFLQNSLAG